MKVTYRKRGVPLTATFFEERSRQDGNGCRLWRKCRCSTGYGVIKVGGRGRRAHRVAYEVLVGPIPDGQFVMHRCDNRACVNVDHLALGTHKDNMQDMNLKGRHVAAWTYQDYDMIRPRKSGRFAPGARRARHE